MLPVRVRNSPMSARWSRADPAPRHRAGPSDFGSPDAERRVSPVFPAILAHARNAKATRRDRGARFRPSFPRSGLTLLPSLAMIGIERQLAPKRPDPRLRQAHMSSRLRVGLRLFRTISPKDAYRASWMDLPADDFRNRLESIAVGNECQTSERRAGVRERISIAACTTATSARRSSSSSCAAQKGCVLIQHSTGRRHVLTKVRCKPT